MPSQSDTDTGRRRHNPHRREHCRPCCIGEALWLCSTRTWTATLVLYTSWRHFLQQVDGQLQFTLLSFSSTTIFRTTYSYFPVIHVTLSSPGNYKVYGSIQWILQSFYSAHSTHHMGTGHRTVSTNPIPEKVLLFAFLSLISLKHNIADAVIELSNLFSRNFFLQTTSPLLHLTKRRPFKCNEPEQMSFPVT